MTPSQQEMIGLSRKERIGRWDTRQAESFALPGRALTDRFTRRSGEFTELMAERESWRERAGESQEKWEMRATQARSGVRTW